MGLFDNLDSLLGTSKTTQTANNNQNTTPIAADASQTAVKADSATLAAIDEMLDMSSANVPANMPSYTAQKSAWETVSLEFDALATKTDEPTETPNSPIISETPIITFDVQNTDSVVSSSQEPSPVILSETLSTTENPPIVTSESMQDVPVFDLFANAGNATENSQKIAEIPLETSPENTIAPAIFSENSWENMPKSSPVSTEDFIATSLAQLATMKLSLDSRKKVFLDKAEEYRKEKEKFAELEADALRDSASMDDERARIEMMEKYFEKQKSDAENQENVTIERKTTRKTTKTTA